jgi:hypothetical protein
MTEDTSLLPGERRIVDAVRSWSMDRHPCDLSGEVDAERTVRASVLKRLITGETTDWGIDPVDVFTIDLCGAHIVRELGGCIATTRRLQGAPRGLAAQQARPAKLTSSKGSGRIAPGRRVFAVDIGV